METQPAVPNPIGPVGANVLVVDDDATLRDLLAGILRAEGYSVASAADGEAALARLKRQGRPIDLILMDLVLPGLGGMLTLWHIRSEWELPVIVVTARHDEDAKVDCFELGADDYVTKPFAPAELLARIRAALRGRERAAIAAPQVLRRNALWIDVPGRRVLVHGRDLALQPRELDLLVALATEPGRVFSRRELLDQAWGKGGLLVERNVDVTVGQLRAKLRTSGLGDGSIQTVRAAGYQFAAGVSGADLASSAPTYPWGRIHPRTRADRLG